MGGESKRRAALGLGPKNLKTVTIKVPADQLKDRICEKCEGQVFVSAMALKEIPAIYSQSGIPETMMIQLGFACVQCGWLMSLRPGEDQKTDENPKPEEKKEESEIILTDKG